MGRGANPSFLDEFEEFLMNFEDFNLISVVRGDTGFLTGDVDAVEEDDEDDAELYSVGLDIGVELDSVAVEKERSHKFKNRCWI